MSKKSKKWITIKLHEDLVAKLVDPFVDKSIGLKSRPDVIRDALRTYRNDKVEVRS